jgi:hypothetical protein
LGDLNVDLVDAVSLDERVLKRFTEIVLRRPDIPASSGSPASSE